MRGTLVLNRSGLLCLFGLLAVSAESCSDRLNSARVRRISPYLFNSQSANTNRMDHDSMGGGQTQSSTSFNVSHGNAGGSFSKIQSSTASFKVSGGIYGSP